MACLLLGGLWHGQSEALIRCAQRGAPLGLKHVSALLSWQQQSVHTSTGAAPTPAAWPCQQRHVHQQPRLPLPAPKLDFSDTQAAFAGKSTPELLRAWLVFRLCGLPGLVSHAESLLGLSNRVLGKRLTLGLVKSTFFNHFCAGETEAQVLQTMRGLHKRGVGGILDYAAESDVTPAQPAGGQDNKSGEVPCSNPTTSIGTSGSTPQGPGATKAELSPASGLPVLPARAVARQYPYSSEQQCDEHVATFLASIKAAAAAPGQGFAAIKLTALGNPALLERVSSAITEVQATFRRWDKDGSGSIDRHEFDKAYGAMLPDADQQERSRVFAWMDTQGRGKVDYVGWCQRLSLSKMPAYAVRILHATANGSQRNASSALGDIVLTEQEVELVRAMRGRLTRIAGEAASKSVKLMVDAEHTYFQRAIDHLTLELMHSHNAGSKGAVVYNTYQAYLTSTPQRLALDLERARREGYVLGAKLVRGAYLELERARAQRMGYPSPVWDTLQQTHESYQKCSDMLLEAVATGRAEVLLGTHNQASIEHAVGRMAALGLTPEGSPVYFGQLLGMSDHLTQVLGGAGYQAYKYCPYGKVELVIPYLLRRALENSAVLKGTQRDLQMITAELARRARRVLHLA